MRLVLERRQEAPVLFPVATDAPTSTLTQFTILPAITSAPSGIAFDPSTPIETDTQMPTSTTTDPSSHRTAVVVTPHTTTPSPGPSHGLSRASLAGIAIGAASILVFLVCITIFTFVACRRKKRYKNVHGRISLSSPPPVATVDWERHSRSFGGFEFGFKPLPILPVSPRTPKFDNFSSEIELPQSPSKAEEAVAEFKEELLEIQEWIAEQERRRRKELKSWRLSRVVASGANTPTIKGDSE